MSDSTRARLERLSADSARFAAFQDSTDRENRRRDAEAKLLESRALAAERRADVAASTAREALRRVELLGDRLLGDATAGDSVLTLAAMVGEQRSVIQAQGVEITELRSSVTDLRASIHAKDSTIAAERQLRARADQRLADTEQVARDLQRDLTKATECRVDLGLFDFKCPSRKAIATVTTVVGIGLGYVAASVGR